MARKLLRKKEKRKERDRLILLAQKDRRKKRVEESSIAQQRLLSMMDTDYSQWIAEGYDNSKINIILLLLLGVSTNPPYRAKK